MKSLAALITINVVAGIDTSTLKYMQYISKHSKSYNTIEEFDMRLQNFIATESFIQEWNTQGETAHRVGHNFLSDWTQAEKDVISGKAAKNAEKAPT